jgi:hypothetical protein
VDAAVAISTERDQIFVCIVTQQTSRAQVVDLGVHAKPWALIGNELRRRQRNFLIASCSTQE